MRLIAGLTLALAIVAVPVHARAEAEVSGIVHVVDGDTIHLSVSGAGKVVKVRLLGVAAPERNEAGGVEATKFVEQLAEGREVRCELDGTRSKDRVVGTCFVGGDGSAAGVSKDIGAAVIAAGFARDCPRFSGGRYRALERPEAARLAYPSYCVPRTQKGATVSAPAAAEPHDRLALNDAASLFAAGGPGSLDDLLEHGGGLNGCGCHFNRKTGECHCHRGSGCGCACEPSSCDKR